MGRQDHVCGSVCAPIIPEVSAQTADQAFFEALANGDLQKIKDMLRADPSLVFRKDQAWGQTPLFLATSRSEEVVRLMLADHADVNVRDPNGTTPLHIAIEYGAGIVAPRIGTRIEMSRLTARGRRREAPSARRRLAVRGLRFAGREGAFGGSRCGVFRASSDANRSAIT